MENYYAVVEWEDGLSSIINLKSVVQPRKQLQEYLVGEDIKAPFKGIIYKAKVIAIGGKEVQLSL